MTFTFLMEQRTSIPSNSIANHLQETPRMYAGQTCYEALRMFQSNPEATCVVVCDKANSPVGLVMRDLFFLKFNGPRGIDMLGRQSITKLMKRAPITADINLPLQTLIEACSTRPVGNQHDCAIITLNGKLIGIIKTEDL